MFTCRCVTLLLMLATIPTSSCACATVPGDREPASPAIGGCQPVESARFAFHSDPWINLHHFLFQWARQEAEPEPGDRRRAVEVAERAEIDRLPAADGARWQRAVDYYRDSLVARDLLFDRGLIELRDRLGAIECSGTGHEGLDAELRGVLVGAMEVYRRQWWPAHHASNLAWIEDRLGQLERWEETVATRLADAYGGEWPATPIRVDVVAYANWAGAYTTNRPDQITISSTDYQDLAGFELLFHEVSHAAFFEQRILGHLAAAFRKYESEASFRLFHAIQFATPAEILRSLLPEDERESFHSVADAVNMRGPFSEQYRVVLEHWRQYLVGTVTREEALDRIASRLAR